MLKIIEANDPIKKTLAGILVSVSVLSFTAIKANADDIHTVTSGDSIWKLATEKYGTTNIVSNVDAIEKENNITDPSKLRIGQQINLDVNGETASAGSTTSNSRATSASTTTSTNTNTATQTESSASSATSTTTTSQASTSNTTTASTGSVESQFLAAGGTVALWDDIVLPESGGNPDAVSSNGYHGLGQTKQAWGYGSVATQTQGLISYAVSRYGSIANAVAFHQANGWW